MTYTVVQRDRNSWTEDANRVCTYQRVADCGHKHKTIYAAIACKDKFKDTFLGHQGTIEDNATGRTVSDEQLQDAGYWGRR